MLPLFTSAFNCVFNKLKDPPTLASLTEVSDTLRSLKAVYIASTLESSNMALTLLLVADWFK